MTSDTALAVGKVDPGSVAKAAAGKAKSKKKKPAVAAVKDTVAAKKEVPLAVVDSIVAKMDSTAMEVKMDSAAPAQVAMAAPPDSSVRDKRDIIRLSTENIVQGKLMIYVDRTGPANDTIRIIIPRSL